jgi:hypothetical protein
MALWLLLATSTYALSDDQAEVLAENRGYLCTIAANGTWGGFLRRLSVETLDIVYALQNLKCTYTDANADRQIGNVLQRVTFVSNAPGAFTQGLLRHLRNNADFETMKSTMWILVAPNGTKRTLLDDILAAYKSPSTDVKVKKQLRSMALITCHNLRLYGDGHLKMIYEDMCV